MDFDEFVRGILVTNTINHPSFLWVPMGRAILSGAQASVWAEESLTLNRGGKPLAAIVLSSKPTT
jgi:hypothetical protein